MRSMFPGYYQPGPAEYERLWKDALIVLDTNVLLDLYRLPTSARDEFLAVLALLKDRLWIPHQVALEFQRQRLTVISKERKSTGEALESSRDLVVHIRRKVDSLQIEKRGLNVDAKRLLHDLEGANAQLISAIERVHESQLQIGAMDPVRDRLDELLAGNVGPAPADQSGLDMLVRDGEERYRDRIPPGFADMDKDRNPNEATFVHDHLKYQRKFGDLILWRQLIEHVKSTGKKAVLLVTADKKEDWWWREQGKTIGAHPELVSEIKRESEVDIFWMYSSVQFLEHAITYVSASVSNQSVAELQQVIVSGSSGAVGSPYLEPFNSGADREQTVNSEQELSIAPYDLQSAESGVGAWLTRIFSSVSRNPRGFPDFLVRRGDDLFGYELKYARSFGRMLLSPTMINCLLRGYLEIREGRLAGFTMVLVIGEADFFEISNGDRSEELRTRLSRILGRYPVSGIVVGAMISGEFQPLVWERAAGGDLWSTPGLGGT